MHYFHRLIVHTFLATFVRRCCIIEKALLLQLRKEHPMELNYELIGSHVRDARQRRNIQQKELAQQIDCAPSYISNIERGLARPSLGVLFSIAEILGVTLNDLVYGSPESVTDSREAKIMYIFENAPENKKDLLYTLFTAADIAVHQYDESKSNHS